MNDFILIFLLVLLVTRIFIKDKDTLREFKKLNKIRLLGVAITFVFTVIVVTILIYYGGNWIMGQFSNIFLKAFSFLVIIFLVLSFIGTISDKVVNKITNGALPKN